MFNGISVTNIPVGAIQYASGVFNKWVVQHGRQSLFRYLVAGLVQVLPLVRVLLSMFAQR